MSTVTICRQIESHSCCIDGVTYTFEVHSAAISPGSYGRAVLQIGGYRQNGVGATLIAIMRVTAALAELERVPGLLTGALEQWLGSHIVPTERVH